MSIPERDIVDRRIDGARSRANESFESNPTIKALALIAVDLVEAIVREIRDADDTQATVIEPSLKERLDDLTQVIGENLGPIAHALQNQGNGKRGGLFG